MKTHFGASACLRRVAAASLLVLAASSALAQTAPPTATFGATSLVRDTEALLPLMDFVPLFSFNMKYSGDTPAPRVLSSLSFTVTGDLVHPDDRSYAAVRGPHVEDLLDFAIFYDNPTPGPTYDTLGDEDFILATFDNMGAPLGDVDRFDDDFPDDDDFRLRSPLHYILDKFIENGVNINASGSEDGNNYIVAVRTSALWHSGMTLGVYISNAVMVNPFGSTGDDSYPNNNWEDPVFEEVGYSSSFTVFDYSSGPLYEANNRWANAWNHPDNTYTPLTEHARPRWDLPAQTFEVVFGEALGLRRLFPIESWIPLLGINAHTTTTQHEIDPLRPADPDLFANGDAEENLPDLREVNMTLIDMGGQSGSLAGSGGFDPRKHLDPMTASGYYPGGVGNANNAIGIDYTYNGLWVFYDTNNNGVFDPPVPGANGGAQLTDHPMLPDNYSDFGTPELADRYKDRWQFIDNPPDGGDPWWRVKLRFFDGRRRPGGGTVPTGFVEPTPDNFGPGKGGSEISPDFFVVARADSGFQDASLVPGDGTGYLFGGDFKATIEPRWFDPVQGHWQGGIHISTQIPGVGEILGDRVLTAWQDDPRWLEDEPWWPQRTSNASTTKPVRGGVEIHDYTLLYESNSRFTTDTFELWYATSIDSWVDPLGTVRDHFYYGFSFEFPSSPDSPRVIPWHVSSIQGTYQGVPIISDGTTQFTFPFETAPFYKRGMDDNINGPRSPVYLFPPAQPTLPSYSTWPLELGPGEYPTYYDWDPQFRRARLLNQKIEINSMPTPLLGINLVGAGDPVVNRVAARVLNEIYVAFWGPDFTKSDLMPLQKDGLGTLENMSGVQLRFDADQDGSYNNPMGIAGITTDTDSPLKLKDLAWPTAPEHVDLDGDMLADDLDGDGVVTAKDVAWVLRLIPLETPYIPSSDQERFGGGGDDGGGGGGGGGGDDGGGDDDDDDDGGFGFKTRGASAPAVTPRGSVLVDMSRPGALQAPLNAPGSSAAKVLASDADDELPVESTAPVKSSTRVMGPHEKIASLTKALPLQGNPGDDLFITVRTSATIGRFEKFRAFIPAYLPDRARTQQQAGIKTTPTVQISAGALEKTSPDEGPAQDYYYHDLMETNMPVILKAIPGPGQTITSSSPPMAVIGIDVSTNRGTTAGVAAQGASGVAAPGTFTVTGTTWTPNAFTGYFLVDHLYRAYEIYANTASQLSLNTTATPSTGKWFVAKDPTFLEQIIVEFYDEGADGGFSILDDLMPLDKDNLAGCGVMIYRDNDNAPGNVNGKFDSTDLPLALDADPQLIGESGEVNTQVKFVFSSPGTDDVPVPKVQQAPLRQWVPDTFAAGLNGDPFNGDDFFVVVRTSPTISTGDDFTVGLVSWGPDTPTQPDADTFVRDNVPEIHKDGLAQFLEFPWGSRALGFITFFKTPPDNSGFNWIRSTVAQNVRTRPITASSTGGPDPISSVVITAVTPSAIQTIPEAGTLIRVTGTGFGTAPVLLLEGQNATLEVVSTSNTQIVVRTLAGTEFDEGSIQITVQNTTTGVSGTNDTLFSAIEGDVPPSPEITEVNPETGSKADFPVTIFGSNFETPDVFFGNTKMPVPTWTATRIVVNFPETTDLPTGQLDVVVKCNYTVDGKKVVLSATKVNGFYYRNAPARPAPPCFIATAAYGTSMGKHLDTFRTFRDEVLLQTAPGTAFVDLYYTMSPPVAKVVAANPWLAALVRIVLTPVAWLIEQPIGLILPVTALWLSRVARRRRARA